MRMVPIVSGGIQGAEAVERQLNNFLTAVAKDYQADFGATVQSWSRSPDFSIKEGNFKRDIFTKDSLYGMLDEGTSPHVINAVNAKALSIRNGFRPKTFVRQLRSASGGYSGGVTFQKSVSHPGTKPREWVDTAIEKWERQYQQIFDRMVMR